VVQLCMGKTVSTYRKSHLYGHTRSHIYFVETSVTYGPKIGFAKLARKLPRVHSFGIRKFMEPVEVGTTTIVLLLLPLKWRSGVEHLRFRRK